MDRDNKLGRGKWAKTVLDALSLQGWRIVLMVGLLFSACSMVYHLWRFFALYSS